MLLVIVAVVGLVVLVRIYHLMLQNWQLTLLLEERRLLIERGVTDLPPLELPERRTQKASRSTLIAGIVLMLVSVSLSSIKSSTLYTEVVAGAKKETLMLSTVLSISTMTIEELV